MGPITGSHKTTSVYRAGARGGSLESFGHDGMEIARRKGRRRRELPWRQVLYFLVAVVSFKLFLFFDMGAAAYGAKIEELSQGGPVDRLAARAMVLDPVSEWIAGGVTYGRW